MPSDTIAAIATARGLAALAIVRMSGPSALQIIDTCFRSKTLSKEPSHTVHVGMFWSPDGEPIDEVVVTLFKTPRSVTGEDVVEVSCHGGDYTQQQVLRALLDAGARQAMPGEFTQRAFLNGKMDLAQAEAVADLIHANSTLYHRVSLSHLHGRYSEKLSEIRSRLLDSCALIELELDFAEEDVEFAERSDLVDLLDQTEALLRRLIGSEQLGRLVRDGVRVVIGGRPNAGKSTLLNALVGTDRAIVSDIPGTTRDEIEVESEIDGLLFRFTDTAGLRETTDAIESEGVRRTHQAISRSAVLVYVYDVTEGLLDKEHEFLQAHRARHPEVPVIITANKSDLTADRSTESDVVISARRALSHEEELEFLKDRLSSAVRTEISDKDASYIVVNERHRQHLKAALEAVLSARKEMLQASGEALALDLRRALNELGGITGEITTEDILGQIFSRFCIGK